jgi:hypothetical protein
MVNAWFTVLKSVPWSTLISNAPVIADGARKLWKAVAKKSPSTTPSPAREPIAADSDGQAVAAIRAQLAAVESAAARLDGQMLASSELIKALAEQNALLIGMVQANCVRILWLGRAVAGLGIVVVAELAVLFVRLSAS